MSLSNGGIVSEKSGELMSNSVKSRAVVNGAAPHCRCAFGKCVD